MKPGDIVYYRPQGGTASYIIRARVERVHRDGTVTIRALFEVDPSTGKDRNGFLDYRYTHCSPKGLHHKLEELT